MSHSNKRRLHHCKNHPAVIAVGRCTACRSWICRQCAVLRKGQFFCATECLSPKPVVPQAAPSSPVPGQSEKRPGQVPLVFFWAGITLGLCGIVFGLWEMRNNRQLMESVESLKAKRIELIEHVKSRNREIASLRKELDSIEQTLLYGAGKKRSRGPGVGIADNGYAKTINGLPVSFDNGSVGHKAVALTFDGSSLSNAVNDILDTLKSRGIKATVFVTGDFIRAYPAAVRRIVDEGHEAGNHTFSHPHLTSYAQDRTQTTLPAVNESFLCNELSRADSMFFACTGSHFAPIWRVPYGEKNQIVCAWGQRCGYLHIGWRQGRTWKQGLDSNDWIPDEETPGFHSPQEVLDKILSLARSEPDGINGGIVLMHLGTVRKGPQAQVHRILGVLIDDLRTQGYTFVTVSEMLRDSGVDINLLKKS